MVAINSCKTPQNRQLCKIARSDKRLFNYIRKEIKGSEKEVSILRIILKLAEDLRNSDQWINLGILLCDIEKYDCAEEVFERAATLNINHYEIRRAKSNAMNRLRGIHEAEEIYKMASAAIIAKQKRNIEIKDLAGYIDEMVIETENDRENLVSDDSNNEDMGIIVPDIQNMDVFIVDLLKYIARDENEEKYLLSKLDIHEDSVRDDGKKDVNDIGIQ